MNDRPHQFQAADFGRSSGDPTSRFLLSTEILFELESLIENDGEREVDAFLRANPSIWSAFMGLKRTGHHGIKVLNKPEIATKLGNVSRGKIPDYILGADNSDGLSHFVVELKGPKDQMFIESRGIWKLSPTASRAIVQTLDYMDFCSRNQGMMRDTYGFEDFREPSGIIFAGRSSHYPADSQARALKSAWNRAVPHIEIRTYDSILDAVSLHLQSQGLLKEPLMREPQAELDQIDEAANIRNEHNFLRSQLVRKR